MRASPKQSAPQRSFPAACRTHRSVRISATPTTATDVAPPSVKTQQAPSTFPIDGKQLPVPERVAPLFTPHQLGRLQLSNRIVYAPLTRCRAIGHIPQPSMATYYAQRTVPGSLLISEATVVSPNGIGYMNVPGLYLPEQLEAWKPVVKAVKDKGGVFFCQLWHTGRASHPDFQPDGAGPVSSSPLAVTSAAYQVYTATGAHPYPVPRELTREEVKAHVQAFATAAKNAVEVCGFDGIEIHGANGYLVDQFIKDGVNKRTDEYGGCIENRCRFALEVVKACCDAIGSDRVGIRFSPFTDFLDAVDSTPYATFSYLVEQLNKLNLAYVHFIEPRCPNNDQDLEDVKDTLAPFRAIYKGNFIAAGSYLADNGAQAVASGAADLVAYGRWYLANPDMHKRFLLGAPLNKYDRDTFYTPGLEGYLDYPTLEESAAQQ